MRAIILAGGKGTRLHPYTVAIPKPLVPIGENQVILEIVIGQLAKHGFDHITITVSHFSNLVMSYFGDGSRWGVKIDYSFEEVPLHTIGALTIIKDLPENFLVINGDTITELNYGELFREHVKRGNLVSVSAKKREVKIDFGVLKFDPDNHLVEFSEKPTHYSYVALGVNCFNRSVIEGLPQKTWYGFDSLMHDSLAAQKPIWIYDFDGMWFDIGRPEDYQHVVEHYDEIKSILDKSSEAVSV
jgi:NDP-mannose synthase